MADKSGDTFIDALERLRLEHHLPPVFWITNTTAREVEGFGPAPAVAAWANALELDPSRSDQTQWGGVIAQWKVTLSATTGRSLPRD